MKTIASILSQLLVASLSLTPYWSFAQEQTTLDKYIQEQGVSCQPAPQGFYYEIEKQGDTTAIQPGQIVKVHYQGSLLNGNVFDSSYERGFPIAFPVGQGKVIKGWDQGIPKIGLGGKGTLYLPPELAYGSRATSAFPANSSLIFKVEVLDTLDEAGYQAWRQEMMAYMQAEREKQAAEAQKQAAEKIKEEQAIIEAYLQENNIEAQQDSSGVYYVLEEKGDESQPVQAGQKLTVHYTGKLFNGQKFDSSLDRGEPFPFTVGRGQVIKGWDQGLLNFNVGSKGTIYIPSPLGYGERGAGGDIPPNSILIFEVEVLAAE